MNTNKPHEATIENKISIITEAKLQTNPQRKLVTVKKTTDRYVDELWLKFLKESEILEGYKMTRAGDRTKIELTFTVEEE